MLKICICDDEPVLCLETEDMLQRYIGKQELKVFEIYSFCQDAKATTAKPLP